MLDQINTVLRRVPTWVIYLLGILPAAWVIGTGLTAIDPVRAIEWGLGLWAVRLLIAALFITPLRWAGLNLLRFRRQLGLVAFAYVVLHFTAWLTIDMGLRWSQILPDLYKRWYIVIGMSALLLLIPLAVTSNNWSIRRMGAKNWGRLHKLAYLATGLAMVHFLMVGKVYTAEVLTYAAILVVLLGIRIWRNGPQSLVPV
ncbi:MAG: sulfoxide reductase heme-binding subunit YedZ [Candidatus Saccharibacteria bacterium]|nr:sulfoxide reductase heme-binding subunit YedZ [Pseudorhodobacter sp.]